MTEQTIPVADLNDFLSDSPAAKQQFVDTVGSALQDIGFFALENHGISSGLIDSGYSVATKFFELSEEEKKKYEIDGLAGQRGFTSFGREHAKDHDAPDIKEFWHVGRDFPGGHRLESVYPKNIWVDELPEFQETFSQLYNQLEKCSQELLKACSLYLGEPENLIADMTTDGDTVMRLIHYPPVSDDVNPKSVRAAAHEDINFITLLCEATAGGLELLQRDGSWRPIHALEGQIVVDSGDMFQNLTNGVFKSTTHRVVNPDNSRERRFSMPYFVHARHEVDLSPLPSCVEKCAGEMKFENITAGEFLDRRLREIGLKD